MNAHVLDGRRLAEYMGALKVTKCLGRMLRGVSSRSGLHFKVDFGANALSKTCHVVLT